MCILNYITAELERLFYRFHDFGIERIAVDAVLAQFLIALLTGPACCLLNTAVTLPRQTEQLQKGMFLVSGGFNGNCTIPKILKLLFDVKNRP